MRLLDRILSDVLEEGVRPASARDFTRTQQQYFGYKLNEVGDPILREHMANWIADILGIQNKTKFVQRVMDNDYFSEQPNLIGKHFAFFAEELKKIKNPYRWKYTYDWVVKAMKGGAKRDINGNRNFRDDLFKTEATPGEFAKLHED